MIRTTPDYSVENHWIDLKTLKDETISAAPKYSLVAVSNDGSIVFNDNSADGDLVHIQRKGASRGKLCSTCMGAVNATFGNGLIFLSTKPAASYIVANTAGEVLMQASHSSSPDFVKGGVGAANSNRAAFLYGHLRGLKAVEHVTVTDVDARKEIWADEVVLEPERLGNVGIRFTTPRLALSPDGDKLAIMTSSTLTLLNLP